MSAESSSPTRRGFLSTSAAGAVTFAALQLATTSGADAQSTKPKRSDLPKIKPGSNTAFASLKQVEAGVLNVGYAEAGPADGPPVILLHGWPYDIHSFVDVTPLLASAGYRVLVPYLRGYGGTRFLSNETFRNAQPSAVGAPHPEPSTYAKKFSGKYAHRTIRGGIGHNLPQESPQAFAEAVVEVDGFAS